MISSSSTYSSLRSGTRSGSDRLVPLGNGIKLAAVVAACLGVSACGAIAEKVTEEGAERLIEAEGGGNVELDFDSGDGSFSIQTEDGSFSLDDNGEFIVTDQDGSVFTGSASDEQLIVLDDNGDPVVDVRADGDGDGGELTVQGGDGESVYRVLTDIPQEWPNDIPRPDGVDIDGGTYITAEGETMITIIGTTSQGAADYVEGYGAALESSGLTESGRYDANQDGNVSAQRSYDNDRWSVNINGYDDGESNLINISVLTTQN